LLFFKITLPVTGNIVHCRDGVIPEEESKFGKTSSRIAGMVRYKKAPCGAFL
jgi:hypothetical protein